MKTRQKRVVILADTESHMMPSLAREMARKNHDLVIGASADGLVEELKELGADVEGVAGTRDQTT